MRLMGGLIIFLLAFQVSAQKRPKNHLANETSLYLLQHAENPVDWYPWGDVALEKARREDKLLFISVGYAACHWCHVMEEESFENEAIAKLLNDNFVSIKIDRERRPDLDEQFSLVTTMLTGSSGWPTSVFMTPDGEPFYAGTYYPPDAFTKVINTITKVWAADRPSLTAEAYAIANEMRAYLDQTAVLGEVSSDELLKVARELIADLDEFYGGFGEAPKFPRELLLLFLLDQATRSGDTELLNAVSATIDGMIRGGISDQLAGGFHRYAIDPEWHVPHFEKMLYNQALIGRVLLRAYAATGNPEYARTATRTFDYVLRDMTAETGAFYSAEDADSLNEAGELLEGIFYVWTPEEITEALGADAPEIIALFDVQDEGMFEGKNVLYLQDLPQPAIADVGLTLAQLDARLERLRLYRAKRSQPIKDKKIILSWNSEMIATLAEAARVLDRPDYYTAAEKAANFLMANLWPDSGLKRIWREGRADVPAQLVDYGAFGSALLALYDYSTDSGAHWLTPAQRLADTMVAQFSDPGKAMRMTAQTAGLGPFRPLDDTEIASGNAQALALLDGLDRRQARVGDLAPRLAGALAIDALNIPDQRAAILNALAVHADGPATALRLSNGGAVRVLASANRQAGQLSLALRLAKGWHINAHEPLEDYLIGMALSVENTPVDVANYPAAQIKELGFSKTPLALYEQDFTIEVPFTMPQSGPAKAVLTLQACNDEVCLPPDDMVFWIW